jgi:L,D-transpeptidase YcbB
MLRGHTIASALVALVGFGLLELGPALALDVSPIAFARLAAAGRELRALAEAGGWPQIPAGPALREGDGGPRVAALRRRLALTDRAEPAGGAYFDAGLRAAVERAQRRHGLAIDGVVGRDTLAALDLSARERLAQVEANLARLDLVPELGPGQHIVVNTAGFELTLIEDGAATLDMKVIVGRPDRATPEFGSALTHLILNPDWTVPGKIARRDILARIRRDPDYLPREGFEVYESWAAGARQVDPAAIDWRRLPNGFPYKLRQRPGPTNALGRIKFMLSSPYDIYLHDTPQKELFQKPVRALSNGCIRLAEPFALAERLMRGTEWADRRDAVLASGRTETIPLPRPVPVHIVYVTAWVDGGGALNLRDDIYGRDRLETGLIANDPDADDVGCRAAAA